MWRRAKFVLPMWGMFLDASLFLLAMILTVVFGAETMQPVWDAMPLTMASIAGVASVGGAGVAAHDTFRDRNHGGAA
jgi:hypothetical protein